MILVRTKYLSMDLLQCWPFKDKFKKLGMLYGLVYLSYITQLSIINDFYSQHPCISQSLVCQTGLRGKNNKSLEASRLYE